MFLSRRSWWSGASGFPKSTGSGRSLQVIPTDDGRTSRAVLSVRDRSLRSRGRVSDFGEGLPSETPSNRRPHVHRSPAQVVDKCVKSLDNGTKIHDGHSRSVKAFPQYPQGYPHRPGRTSGKLEPYIGGFLGWECPIFQGEARPGSSSIGRSDFCSARRTHPSGDMSHLPSSDRRPLLRNDADQGPDAARQVGPGIREAP
jgi:hypothetical protein